MAQTVGDFKETILEALDVPEQLTDKEWDMINDLAEWEDNAPLTDKLAIWLRDIQERLE